MNAVCGCSFVRYLGLTLTLCRNRFKIVFLNPISFVFCFFFHLRLSGFELCCFLFLISLTVDLRYNCILFHCIGGMSFKTGMTDDFCYFLNWF